MRLLDQRVSNVLDKVDLVLLNVRQIYQEQSAGQRDLEAGMLNAALGREEALLPENRHCVLRMQAARPGLATSFRRSVS